MSKHFLALLMLTALVFGCKPRTQEITPYQSIDSKLLELAKVGFEQNQTISLSKSVNPSILETDNRLNYWGYTSFRTFFPIWERSELVNLSNGNKVLITPLRRNMNVNYGNLYYIRRLRIEFDAQENLVKVNIIELVTLKKSVADLKQQIIAHVFEEIETRTNAKIMVFDAGYTPLEQNSSWKGEATNNTNLRGSSDGSDGGNAPNYCYTLTAVASCTDVQYLQSPAPCDDPSTTTSSFVGFGTPINNCPGGSSGGVWTPPSDPNNPTGGSGGGDTGQDDPVITTIIYNGVNLDLHYKNAIGQPIEVDANMIEAFKFVIDHPTYRSLIGAYLTPFGITQLSIKFDPNAGDTGGYFDKNTNTFYMNPNQLKKVGMLEMVNIFIHESLHAMFFKPNATMQSQLDNAKATLLPRYPQVHDNMIHHEAMGQNYKDAVITILRDFHNSSHGVVQNHTPINDNHFEATFLASLIRTQYPKNSGVIIDMWITQLDSRSFSIQDWFGVKWKEIRNIYLNALNP